MEEERKYHIARRIFFWLFLTAFIILAPIVVFYSLGYKFNIDLKRFQKTGAISVKTFPKDASVYLDGDKFCESTPCTLRDLLPKIYTVDLEKNGFYSYKISVDVKPSFVSDIDVNLVPKMRNVKKLKIGLNIRKFFIVPHLFSKEIVAFADKGVYYINDDFSNAREIVPLDISGAEIDAIKGLREEKNKLVFWNNNNVWFVSVAKGEFSDRNRSAELVYSTKEYIKDVFFALKERYLIVHDGMKIAALDVRNRAVSSSIFKLNSVNSKIFYDTNSGTLYIKDKIPTDSAFSLFKVNLKKLVHEKPAD